MLDCIGAKALHLGAGLLAVEGNRLVSGKVRASRQTKDIVDPSRPGETVVRKVAFPAPDVVEIEFPRSRGMDQVSHCTIEDMAKVKVACLLAERPAVRQWKWFEDGQIRSTGDGCSC